MSVNEPKEQDLANALAPFRMDPEQFDDSVFEKVAVLEQAEQDDPLSKLPEWQRSVASILPLPFLSGGKILPTSTVASSVSNLGGLGKVMSVLAFPAIAIFVVLGSALFSRRLIEDSSIQADGTDLDTELKNPIQKWKRKALLLALPVYFGLLLLPIFANGYLVTAVLLGSTVLLAVVLSSLARSGILHPLIVTQVTQAGLTFLAIVFGNYQFAARNELHFLPPSLVYSVLLGGVLGISMWSGRRLAALGLLPKGAPHLGRAGKGFSIVLTLMAAGALVFILWLRLPSFAWPFVSFEGSLRNYTAKTDLDNNSAHWASFTTLLMSAQELGVEWEPTYLRKQMSEAADLTQEVRTRSYILTAGSRIGLLSQVWSEGVATKARDEITRLTAPHRETHRIQSLEQVEWAIRELSTRGQLSKIEIDKLESRILASWPDLERKDKHAGYGALEDMWMITEVLRVLGREQSLTDKRAEVQDWLVRCWTRDGGGFEPGGGFKDGPKALGPSLDATWFAIQLMKSHGVPSEIDFTWVRSALQPWNYSFGSRSYVAQLLLRELDQIDGIPPLTLSDYLRADRNLLLAFLVVFFAGYVIHVTLQAQRVTRIEPGPESAETS